MGAGDSLRRGIRYLVLVLSACFFLMGLVAAAYEREPAAAAGSLLLAAVAYGVSLYLQRVQEPDPFLIWLSEHAGEVMAGTALYEGTPVRPDDELVQFHACTSIVLLSFKYASPFLVPSHQPIARAGLVYSLVTLATGWWGLHGIFWSFQALYKNLRGGTRIRVGDLIGPS